ncbi:MAG: 4-(cytidine 5'-diphospho)-2-C-methyl-D-erythritol kinase [Armatimonadaceae bacterium]|jgi:4-diphosphocytidyl-2-C-methyl-D-erythritol kinase
MDWKQTAPSYAKLNLTLDVGLPRADGYHDIDSIVVPLSISDEITVAVRQGTGQVKLVVKDKRPDRIATPPIPRGEANLVHRAATLARNAWHSADDIDIWCTLVKRLPAEAGLGAGSSNAACVLQLLTSAFGRSPIETAPLAAALGSDVPLFLAGGAVRMRGRGEIVEPIDGIPSVLGVVVRPESGVPTGPAYALLDSNRNRIPGTATDALLADRSQVFNHLHNDFQAPVAGAFPDVGQALSLLREAGACVTVLCGSGSAVFGGADDRPHAVEMVRKLAPVFPFVKIVETMP